MIILLAGFHVFHYLGNVQKFAQTRQVSFKIDSACSERNIVEMGGVGIPEFNILGMANTSRSAHLQQSHQPKGR